MSSTALDLWEAGAAGSPASRALLLLRAAGHLDAAGWTVPARDQGLLAAYCPGPLAAVAQCPRCAQLLDVQLDTRALTGPPLPHPDTVTVRCAGHLVRARLPCAGDLAALDPGAPADEQARDLLRGCVVSAEQDGHPVDPATLTDEVLEAVDDALAAADPDGGLVCELTCAGCGTGWQEVLDPVRFAWARVEEAARTDATDVHTLAAAYGWSEADILAMSPARRRLYLSVVGP